jgi:hypothetical protein
MRSDAGMANRQKDVDLRSEQFSALRTLAWLGLAWLGLAWLGLAWLGDNSTVVELHEDTDCNSSACKETLCYFLRCCSQTDGFGDHLLRFTDNTQLDTDTLVRTHSILSLYVSALTH